MSCTISTSVRAALINGLAAIPSLVTAEVAVSYGWDPNSRARFQMFTGRPELQEGPASIKSGRNFRNEEATFPFVIHVELPGGNEFEADTQADIFSLVFEEWISDRKGNELGVAGLNWIRLDSLQCPGGPTDSAFISQRIYTIRYNARLT